MKIFANQSGLTGLMLRLQMSGIAIPTVAGTVATVFNADGSQTKTYSNGIVIVTTYAANGNITETISGVSTQIIVIVTSFNTSTGSITETVTLH